MKIPTLLLVCLCFTSALAGPYRGRQHDAQRDPSTRRAVEAMRDMISKHRDHFREDGPAYGDEDVNPEENEDDLDDDDLEEIEESQNEGEEETKPSPPAPTAAATTKAPEPPATKEPAPPAEACPKTPVAHAVSCHGIEKFCLQIPSSKLKPLCMYFTKQCFSFCNSQFGACTATQIKATSHDFQSCYHRLLACIY